MAGKPRVRRSVNLKKVSVMAILVNSIEIVAAVAILAMFFLGVFSFDQWHQRILLIFMGVAVVWGAVLDIREAFQARSLGAESDLLEDMLGQLTELNEKLRAQRHDFMNHLQVVYSLIELKDDQEAMRYIEQTYTGIQKLGNLVRTSSPAVNALIAAKDADCRENGIDFSTDIQSSWRDCPMDDWSFCRVLGNLIDNAISAVSGIAKPAIHLTLAETLHDYSFAVENNGPAIEPDTLRRIFERGFTTKPEGHGMGLSIVKELLEENNGCIAVSSSGEKTVFSGTIRKQQKNQEEER